MAEPRSLTLYYNDYSICSIMVRYTIACCKELQAPPFNLSQQPVDIQHGGQLAEPYLCEVNPKGTVPVLVISPSPSSSSSNPDPPETIIIPESIDITTYLANPCPTLFPESRVSQIKQLLIELHEINYFSLTYTHAPRRALDMEKTVLDVLSSQDLSERYRDALELKLQLVRATRFPALEAATVAAEEEKTSTFLSRVETLLDVSTSRWVFGTEDPTALDTHLVPFIARLLDVGRESMLPVKVKGYALRAFETEEWKAVMQGRKTVFGSYL